MHPQQLIPAMLRMLKPGGSARILTNEISYLTAAQHVIDQQGIREITRVTILPAGRKDLWSAYDVLLQDTEVFEIIITL